MSYANSPMNRRAFLREGVAGLALSLTAGRGLLAREPLQSPLIYSGRFVPDGAQCRVIFVSDHHYWPDHLENWGGGNQITTNCNRRMPDLIRVLNEERPDLSVHGGDVISAGGSFFPPPEEYVRQLAFAKRFYEGLEHPFMPLIGNHEMLEAHYASEAQLEPWRRLFGPLYRYHDANGWRIIGINCMLPNPDGRHGKGDSYGNVYGMDESQLEWLRKTLAQAESRKWRALICTHVPPNQWVNAAQFESAIGSFGCVQAVVCGHTHRNSQILLGKIPVMIRAANVASPFGYTLLHLYPDGRIVAVQKSQHFPFDDFISQGMQVGAQGAESDRYVTLGGSSELPLRGLKLLGDEAEARIADGHLRLSSKSGRATLLIDAAALQNARLTLVASKAGAARMGALVLTDAGAGEGIEAALTSQYSPDGKVYLAGFRSGQREVLSRSWFNIADNIAYRLALEARNGRVTASWKNMLDLEARIDPGTAGHFGLFVERGTLFLTDLTLDS